MQNPSMPSVRLAIVNGHVLDTSDMTLSELTSVVVEGENILAVGDAVRADIVIDARGGFILPGFIDAHVHFRLATLDFHALEKWSEVEYGLAMGNLARETLHRGFTTVRDLGGDVEGLMRAIDRGTADGPRIVRAGRMLSQTGGHGDAESGPRPVPDCACQMRHTAFGIVADGVDAVRKAARHNLRDGSDFLKIHVSGGVASPSDPLESIQYTPEEVAAVVQEAEHRQTYVAAHAYSPKSIIMAVENGVHTIEHGNLIDDEAAIAMFARGAILVPTLSTYEAMDVFGERYGLPRANREKNRKVLDAGLASLEIARRHGVTLGFGTDLIGETQSRQRREFAIRAEVETAKQILHSLYLVNAQLCRGGGRLGTVIAGAAGDLVVSRSNPLEDIAGLANDNALSAVVKAGKIVFQG